MQKKFELICKELATLIKKTEPPVFAVFDFDNTCIINDIGEAVFHYLARNNLFKNAGNSENVFQNYYKFLDGGKFKEAYKFLAESLNGFSEDEITSLVNEAIKYEGEKIGTAELFKRKIAKGLKSRDQIAELIEFLKNNGCAVWIVTASPEILIRQAIKHFGVEANLIGVRNVVIDGKITDKLENPISMSEGKVECIKKYIDQEKKPILGVGDSINDLPMLEYCDIKIVVDRRNALSERARQNNWILI